VAPESPQRPRGKSARQAHRGLLAPQARRESQARLELPAHKGHKGLLARKDHPAW